MRRAMMSSSAPQLQNSAASVTSMTMSVVATNATSPPSNPKPESIYWVKTPRKLSMTPVFPMRSPPFAGSRRGGRRRAAKESVAAFGPGGEAVGVAGGGLDEPLAAAQGFAERIGGRLE